MKWSEVTEEHHGKKATVSAKSTPEEPTFGFEPLTGIIDCEFNGLTPMFVTDKNRWVFSGWYDVEIEE